MSHNQPLTEADLAAMKDIVVSTHVGTHWDGCHHSHKNCAILRLIAEVERMRTETGEWVRAAHKVFKAPAQWDGNEAQAAREKEGLGELEELMRGCGWCHTPESIAEMLTKQLKEAHAEILRLKRSGEKNKLEDRTTDWLEVKQPEWHQ
jgi:hypothetical protein